VDAVAPNHHVSLFLTAVHEMGNGSRGIGLIQCDKGSVEQHLHTGLTCGARQDAVQVATPNHLQSCTVLDVIVLSINCADDLSTGVPKFKPRAGHAQRRDAIPNAQLAEHVHAVRGHPQKQALVGRLGRSALAHDRVNAETTQERAHRRTGDPAPDDDRSPDVSPGQAVPSFAAAAAIASRTDWVAGMPRRMADVFLPQMPLVKVAIPGLTLRFRIQLWWHERTDADAGGASSVRSSRTPYKGEVEEDGARARSRACSGRAAEVPRARRVEETLSAAQFSVKAVRHGRACELGVGWDSPPRAREETAHTTCQ
jgi:hypothetical protein